MHVPYTFYRYCKGITSIRILVYACIVVNGKSLSRRRYNIIYFSEEWILCICISYSYTIWCLYCVTDQNGIWFCKMNDSRWFYQFSHWMMERKRVYDEARLLDANMLKNQHNLKTLSRAIQKISFSLKSIIMTNIQHTVNVNK